MLTIDEAIDTAEAMSVLATTRTGEEEWAEMAAMLKELKQLKDFYNEGAMKKSLKKEYMRGRNDAIDEVIKFVGKDLEWDDWFEIQTNNFINYLENLKENKNE